MQSKLTLIGLYNYDNTLFDNLRLPAGIDRDLCIQRILNKSEEFEVVYASIDYMKNRIGIWSDIWERTFTKWLDALNINYEPLWNYDRNELYTDTKSRNYKDLNEKSFNDSQVKNVNSNGTEESTSNSSTVTGSTSNSTTEQTVSAYDMSTYSDKEKEKGNATTNQMGNGSANNKLTDVRNSSETTGNAGAENNNASGNSNELMQHSAHLFGNVGVTTSQQMLREELSVVEWNLYEHIADLFIEEFCILIY